ncbi:hypothetical protein CRG98_027133 [Punica granatum]|uniref:Uncharacterized protein n=1 Tax=Punica granatum TaxID=22663 RepID=A0A2I0J8A0_PUNGR|nr:hypothetical protein CRG98_027133 [Punica granatum]
MSPLNNKLSSADDRNYKSPSSRLMDSAVCGCSYVIDGGKTSLVCELEFHLVGARMRTAWECPPSRGHATDARETESSPTILQPGSRGPISSRRNGHWWTAR